MLEDLLNVLHAARERVKISGYPNNEVTRRLREERRFQHRGQNLTTGHRATDELCDLMGGIVLVENLSKGLEIGTLFGYSALHLAEAFAVTGGHLTTVDMRRSKRNWHTGEEVEEIHEAAERFVDEAGYTRVVEFCVGNSNQVLPKFTLEGRRFDFIFIDGSHSRYAVTLDFINAVNLITSEGIIVIDDTSESIAVKDSNHGGPNSILPAIYASREFDILPLNAITTVLRKRG